MRRKDFLGFIHAYVFGTFTYLGIRVHGISTELSDLRVTGAIFLIKA